MPTEPASDADAPADRHAPVPACTGEDGPASADPAAGTSTAPAGPAPGGVRGATGQLVGGVWKGAGAVMDTAREATGAVVDGALTGVGYVTERAWQSAEAVVDGTLTGAEYVTGRAKQGGALIGRGAVAAGQMALVGPRALLKYTCSRRYRNEVANPWIRAVLIENWARIKTETLESQEVAQVLWRYARRERLTTSEKRRAKQQLLEIVKMFPALGIFALPGGGVLLPILAKLLPFHLMPDTFYMSKREIDERAAWHARLRAAEAEARARGVDFDAADPAAADGRDAGT